MSAHDAREQHFETTRFFSDWIVRESALEHPWRADFETCRITPDH